MTAFRTIFAINIEVLADIGAKAEESVCLLVGGYKNRLAVQTRYSLLESTTLGVGGEVFGQDNLSFIVNYADSVGGTEDTLWRTYLRYKILY